MHGLTFVRNIVHKSDFLWPFNGIFVKEVYPKNSIFSKIKNFFHIFQSFWECDLEINYTLVFRLGVKLVNTDMAQFPRKWIKDSTHYPFRTLVGLSPDTDLWFLKPSRFFYWTYWIDSFGRFGSFRSTRFFLTNFSDSYTIQMIRFGRNTVVDVVFGKTLPITDFRIIRPFLKFR